MCPQDLGLTLWKSGFHVLVSLLRSVTKDSRVCPAMLQPVLCPESPPPSHMSVCANPSIRGNGDSFTQHMY